MFTLVERAPPSIDPMPWILAGMETYDSAIEMGQIARTFDVPLTRLETFVRDQVASASQTV